MKLEEIQEMWETDCQIDDNYLGEAATHTPKLHAKYVKVLMKYKLQLVQRKSEYNMLRKNKFRYYRGELSRDELSELGWVQWQGVKPLKNEMDEFLTGDTDLNNSQSRIEYIESIIYLLESIMTQIKSRDWQLRTAVDWKKFLSGM